MKDNRSIGEIIEEIEDRLNDLEQTISGAEWERDALEDELEKLKERSDIAEEIERWQQEKTDQAKQKKLLEQRYGKINDIAKITLKDFWEK